MPRSKTPQSPKSELADAVQMLAEELKVLRMVVDELREELQWATRIITMTVPGWPVDAFKVARWIRRVPTLPRTRLTKQPSNNFVPSWLQIEGPPASKVHSSTDHPSEGS